MIKAPCKHDYPQPEGCRWCTLAMVKAPEYRKVFWPNLFPQDGTTVDLARCVYLGKPTGESVKCGTCIGKVDVKLFECQKFGECTLAKEVAGVQCCAGRKQSPGLNTPCPGYTSVTSSDTFRLELQAVISDIIGPHSSPESSLPKVSIKAPVPKAKTVKVTKRYKWAYGVTTVQSRRDNVLKTTLESLKNGGFDKPRLFVDGTSDIQDWEKEFNLPVTARTTTIRTFGNWMLGMLELYIRTPTADYYAMFQDDIIVYKNLRGYLEASDFPKTGYMNLYTFPKYQDLAPKGESLWYKTTQEGLGALGLVFTRNNLLALLGSHKMLERPMHLDRGWRAIDGGIVWAANRLPTPLYEYVHSPSLSQHIGDLSSMGNRAHPKAPTFLGEDFDAMELV